MDLQSSEQIEPAPDLGFGSDDCPRVLPSAIAELIESMIDSREDLCKITARGFFVGMSEGAVARLLRERAKRNDALAEGARLLRQMEGRAA